MNNRNILLTLLLTLFLFGCQDEATQEDLGNAVELTTVKAEIVSGEATTRATNDDVVYLEDNISRFRFVNPDKMVFTKIHRTNNELQTFSYTDIGFNCNSSGSWERDKATGYSKVDATKHPERIYWSDAASPHTFIGYSLPASTAFDWKKSTYYYDSNNQKQEFTVFYGAIGDPTKTSEEIDYTDTSTEEITTVDDNEVETTTTISYSPQMRNEDLLLTYDNNLTADNSVAKIKFYHALSSVRVIVNISGFYGSANDAYSVVSNMKLLDQPTIYRWMQRDKVAEPLLTEHENQTLQELWGTTNTPKWDQRKHIKLWCKNPEGNGTGSSKTFTFYGITVPQTSEFFNVFTTKELKLTFDVTYPDPMKNDPQNHKITKSYSATIPYTKGHVNFYPGKCTTINLSLNHKDETMTIGASYMDWQFVVTPDEGTLKKKSTFLQHTERSKITIAADAAATADDATWLYNTNKNNGGAETIVDIYGNDGTLHADGSVHPYTICTADELLSFAYEVKSGRSFAGKYVKLDADITMQKTYDLKTDDSGNILINQDLIQWIGIGDKDNPFDGFFLGNGRHINYLYGKPFFNTIGVNAVIGKLDFSNAIQVNGTGVVADVNNGLLCGCNVEGDVKQADGTAETEKYCGSFVGDNQSFIIGCTHIGSVTGHRYVGGLVGRNAGTIIASYHVGVVKFADGVTDPNPDNKTDGYNVGGSTGLKEANSQVFSCYFNSELIEHTPETTPGRAALGLTTAQMQSNDFVNKATDIAVDAGVDVSTLTPEQQFQRHFSLNKALDVFKTWLNSIWTEKEKSGDDWTVETNCRTFTRSQVYWLKNHYNETHTFKYTPGTYPKIQ